MIRLTFLLGLALMAGLGLLVMPLRGTPGAPAREAPGRVDIIDMTGTQVAVPALPRRVLSLCTSATSTIVSIGAGGRLAAVDEYSRIIPGAGHLPVIATGGTINAEQVIASRIDLAFVWWYQQEAAAMLRRMNVPVVLITSPRVSKVPDMVELVGRAVGEARAASSAADRLRRSLKAEDVPADVLKVYLEMYAPCRTAGRGTYADDLLALAGVDNIARDLTGSGAISMERLAQLDPDVIVVIEGFATAQSLRDRSGFAELSAVRLGRVVTIDRSLLVAGPEMFQAVEQLRRKFKPFNRRSTRAAGAQKQGD